MKKKSACILLVFAAVIVLTYMTGESYYRGISEKAGLDEQEEKIYKYQYDMIVDSPDSQFWQAVYDSAKKKAASNNVLLEIMGPDRETSYDKLDYMNMSIAAKADGIILQYNGEAGLEEAINTAVRNGIPVVTVMSDAVHSRRQSFVGVSDYQLGMAYGEIVARYVNENTKKILILQKRDIDDMNESQIYTQISNAVQTAVGSADIEIKGRNLLSTGTFETEEAVTDIFQQKRNIPDILVCMDEETTECARQAVLDFNLAGKVEIIGYYTSEDILAAVEKVNHPSLPDHPDHALYEKYFPNGGGSIFTFNIKGGVEEAHKFIDNLQVFSLLANVADVKSLVIHPATTTHSQLTEEELADVGIQPNTIRLSIGTEHIDDILFDLKEALDQI